MAKIFVDGAEYEVDEKKNLIDALKDKGLEIPHFCYHSKLSVVGMCRICLIEIEGVPKFQAACNTPIKDGMKINAFGEKIVKAREGVMEFLLINHPLDCPVCDKAGECRLQNYSFALGHDTTRYQEEKRNIPQEKIGTNLLINHNRCILCYRCVRFDREIVGVSDLEMLARGNDTIIAYTPPETSGEKSTYLNHNFQGALADICPVGALLNENTLFQSRVWWYDQEPSVCHGCSTLCSVTTNVRNNELYRYMPSGPDDFICDHGRFSARDFSTNRLLYYALAGERKKSTDVWPVVQEKIKNAKSIVILGGATESIADLDAIDNWTKSMLDQGKTVQWDFRAHENMFGHDGQAQSDFLMAKDLRPNAAYAREKQLAPFSSISHLETQIRAADVILVLAELSAPYAYRENSVAESSLYKMLDAHGLWSKVVNFTTHQNSAVERAFATLPVLSFPEKTGQYKDKNGAIKRSAITLKAVQGLKAIAQNILALEPQKAEVN